MRNGHGYSDPTAGSAIFNATHPKPRTVSKPKKAPAEKKELTYSAEPAFQNFDYKYYRKK